MFYKKIINKLYKKTFNPPTYDKTIKSLFPKGDKLIMLDVGANIGQTIDWAIRLFDDIEIYSFEPTKKLFAELESKYKNISNIHLFKLAVSNFNGKTAFYTTSHSLTNSLLKPKMNMYKEFAEKSIYNQMKEQFEETVEVIKLDDWYYNKTTLQQIDILKIDTQGNDFNVLLGAINLIKNNKIRVIIIEIEYLEFYEDTIPFYKVIEFLMDHSFYLYSIFDNIRLNNGQLIESNYIFTKRI